MSQVTTSCTFSPPLTSLFLRRVMEWLRHVDLSEYAPNLRGSGVHGALLVMEKRCSFNLALPSVLLDVILITSVLQIHSRAACLTSLHSRFQIPSQVFPPFPIVLE